MANVVRIPITNIFMGGDYTGQILVGAGNKPLNVILDTGSSALALDGNSYTPNLAQGDTATKFAQTDSYGDGSSWAGAVITTGVTAGGVALPGANVAVAYEQSATMFRSTDGILGLAYAPLDDAYAMPDLTWPKKYTSAQIQAEGTGTTIAPYLTQLAAKGIAAEKVAFYTLRSFVHEGGGDANDPLNKGWMILGGGEESTDLYTGTFQSVSVLADDWYNTNLKAILVGTASIHVPTSGPKGMPSNSIIDSGTNSLNLSPSLLKAVLSKFNPTQRALLQSSVMQGQLVSVSDLGDLSTWPALTFVMQGDGGDVSLTVAPGDYWQVDVQNVGTALAAITSGQAGLTILGLPLMSGYFTIFDGTADGGRGVVKFATNKRS